MKADKSKLKAVEIVYIMAACNVQAYSDAAICAIDYCVDCYDNAVMSQHIPPADRVGVEVMGHIDTYLYVYRV